MQTEDAPRHCYTFPESVRSGKKIVEGTRSGRKHAHICPRRAWPFWASPTPVQGVVACPCHRVGHTQERWPSTGNWDRKIVTSPNQRIGNPQQRQGVAFLLSSSLRLQQQQHSQHSRKAQPGPVLGIGR